MVAVLGASLLFFLPTDWPKREFTLRWADAAKIDWGTVVLFGTGLIALIGIARRSFKQRAA